jgi:hypothetical protein
MLMKIENAPENLKLRQIITDFIFWNDVCPDNELESLQDLIEQIYKIMAYASSQYSETGAYTRQYQDDWFSGATLQDWDWLHGFGFFEMKAVVKRKPEKVGIKSTSTADDILTVTLTPSDELINYVKKPSKENTAILLNQTKSSLSKYHYDLKSAQKKYGDGDHIVMDLTWHEHA